MNVLGGGVGGKVTRDGGAGAKGRTVDGVIRSPGTTLVAYPGGMGGNLVGSALAAFHDRHNSPAVDVTEDWFLIIFVAG